MERELIRIDDTYVQPGHQCHLYSPPNYVLEYADGHPLIMSNGDVTWLYNKTAYRQFGNHYNGDSLLYQTKVNQEVDAFFNSGQVRIFNERLPTVVSNSSRGLKVDSSGRIYSLSEFYRGADGIATLLYRYNIDGTLDTSFGTGGYTLLPDLYPYHLALDSQNRILINGRKHFGGFDWSEGLWRLNSSGALDTTFATVGHIFFTPPADHKVSIFVGSWQERPLVIDSSDNILMVAYYYNEVDYEDQIALWKVTSTGTMAANFGSQGVVKLSFDAQSGYEISGLILAANGDIYPLKMMEDDVGAERVALFRVPAETLQVDENFGTDRPWKFLIGPEESGDDARGYTPQWTVDPQGRFLVTTYYVTPASPFGYTDKVALRRFTADGDLDSTFLNGKGWSHQMTPDREWFSLSAAVDPKGRILIIVDEGGPQIKSTNWIRAFSDTGQPDTTFGNSGVISVESLLGLTESQDAWTQHALTAPSGKILLSLQGYDPATNGLPIDLLVVIK